ncbi:MAG: Cobalamin import system permease protein BtuC [Methanosaeta sp. PtaB.Bin039]|nr:MAG: Cobalamin import system permease protein BtuC [Methanosaeta sp. PtaB.Bin039]OPY45023.1 MAG: Cobalamin import system permease protein BtuC [Methanosaeta sp. PtaU1.Bin028]HOT08045.1 iron ABC transporter permease [Methanotrichaceae archaeon]HQF17738.1 iron ABC transporter permease [Methanotrichaceae archaeon]HQI92363.1 iron ABC transporter permease [Methanotrichaceae archaeon]
MICGKEPVAEGGPGIRERYSRFVGRKMAFLFLLSICIVLLAGFSATLGSANLSVSEVYFAILARFFPGHFQTTWFAETVVWGLRLHRIMMAMVAGAGLAVAGAAMQGILRNPLASPFTLGISSAASFGAALAIVMGAGFAGGEYLIIGNAFLCTLLASLAVYGLARYKGITPETMILAGIAIMYLFSALTSFLQYVGQAEQVAEVVFWMMGSLGRSSWEKVWMVLAVLALCLPYLLLKSWDINALGAGDETAKSLGVNVERTRVVSMMLASLITASVICFTGTIGFVGLVSPHIARMAIGADNRFLLPASALCGSLLLLAADAAARTILAPVILPVGIMTSFLGVPFFIYLFLKRRKEFW